MPSSTPAIAILGGTFDPVHNAHLAIARAALEQLGAGRVLWLPTGAPGYREAPVASAADRLAMLRAAIAGEARFAIDARELEPGASGYTYDSMRALAAEHPGAGLVLLMGADQYAKRAAWHRWPELERLCRVAVAARPGAPAPGGGALRLELPELPVSASEIRARLGRGEDAAALVPPAVLRVIREKGLYR